MFVHTIQSFVDLLLPRSCLACSGLLTDSEEQLCTYCLGLLPSVDYHLYADNPMAQKFYGKVSIRMASALFSFSKKSALQQLLHQIKYKDQPAVAETLGRYYGQLLKEKNCYTYIEAILPVPLHPERQAERGYNQSACLASGLAEGLGKPHHPHWLRRVVNTSTQTNKGRVARWENVANAFVLASQRAVKGKHILLIDDLVTTGATLEAAALTLQEAQVASTSILTLAVAK